MTTCHTVFGWFECQLWAPSSCFGPRWHVCGGQKLVLSECGLTDGLWLHCHGDKTLYRRVTQHNMAGMSQQHGSYVSVATDVEAPNCKLSSTECPLHDNYKCECRRTMLKLSSPDAFVQPPAYCLCTAVCVLLQPACTALYFDAQYNLTVPNMDYKRHTQIRCLNKAELQNQLYSTSTASQAHTAF